MPVIKYHVILPDKERSKLSGIISKGTASAKSIMHAHVLLAADESNGEKRSEKEIASLFHVNAQTVYTIRKTSPAMAFTASSSRAFICLSALS